jgi:hypothetical protein
MTKNESFCLHLLAAAALFLVSPFCDAAQAKDRAPNRHEAEKGTNVAASAVPFVLDSQRILLEVSFETPEGGARKALAWFNMGMARPVLDKSLYRELAVDHREAIRVVVGDKTIEASASEFVDGDGGVGVPTFSHLFAPREVEAMLPASLLQRYVVTLDYGRRTFALAEPGAQKLDGVAVPCLVNPKTGLVAVEAEIGGVSYPVAIDAGSGYSWMRGDVARRWLAEHPDWRRAEGAVGQANANMVDFTFEKEGVVFRVPHIALGALSIGNVGVLGTAPILGSFGDSLFGDLFWDNWHKAAPAPVFGWAETPTVADAQIGDELVAVDGAVIRGAGKDAVFSALHGKPGERRRLVLERGSAQVEVDAAVTSFDKVTRQTDIGAGT